MADVLKRFLPHDSTCTHARVRTPLNPDTYKPKAPYAIWTGDSFHECGITTLADSIAVFVRYGHPVLLLPGQSAFVCDYDGVVVLGWRIRWGADDPVQWFGIPAAAQIFADNPLVDPIEAETVIDKVREPA